MMSARCAEARLNTDRRVREGELRSGLCPTATIGLMRGRAGVLQGRAGSRPKSLPMNSAAEHGNNISSNLWLRPGWMPGRVRNGRRREPGTRVDTSRSVCKVVGLLRLPPVPRRARNPYGEVSGWRALQLSWRRHAECSRRVSVRSSVGVQAEFSS